MNLSSTTILVGVDSGPCETLAPLAKAWGAKIESVLSSSTEFWTQRICNAGADLVVTGTSDSAEGRLIETATRIAARQAGVPLAVMEDYPGNYELTDAGDADLLLVESQRAASLAHVRLGARCPQLQVVSPARFDAMRATHVPNRLAMQLRWNSERRSGQPYKIFWAGQPETEDALVTLAALLPALLDGGYRLLFRAHPRDAGYVMGAYRDLAQALGPLFLDVTQRPPDEVFALAPRLLVTQFSSMVVEAGFHGIPSMCLLLPRAGMSRLLAKKGYSVPPACADGAVVLCTESVSLNAVLQGVLENDRERAEQLIRFDAYFQVETLTTPLTVQALETLITAGD